MPPDITLVHPLFIDKDPVEREIMTPYFPLGLMYLAAVLRQHGYTVEMFDCAFHQDYDVFEQYMRQTRPRVVGITALTTVRRSALVLADIAHRYGATVIAGGADPTASPERYLFHTGSGGELPVDAVAFKEGEMTMLALADHVFRRGDHAQALDDIAGLRLRGDDGQVIATAPRPFIPELDSLPFPARDLVDLDAYRAAWRKAHGYWSLSIIHTRGCPYACTWCQKAVFGRTYRARSAHSAADEMRHIKEAYAPDRVRVVDDVTGIGQAWLSTWRDAILARDALIPFECLSRVNLATEEMLTTLKDAGCRKVFFGAESGSQKVLDAMNKEITVAQIHEAANLCRRLGIEMYFYMMVGYPGETWADLRQSVRLLRQTRPDEFSTTIAYPLPGTAFYEQVRDRPGFEGDCPPDWTHSAENRLLFQRSRYNTYFYRRVIRWFHNEWKDAWLRAGKQAAPTERFKTVIGLWRDRALVNLLARLPSATHTRFRPTVRPPVEPAAGPSVRS
jgi:anaerobic magnesium-protoporphyrin IX monomethyl ester cyclase